MIALAENKIADLIEKRGQVVQFKEVKNEG
jgi:hypothetical protein